MTQTMIHQARTCTGRTALPRRRTANWNKPWAFAIACALSLSACEAPTATRPAFAYDPTTLSRGQLYRWQSGRQIRVWTEVVSGPATVDLSLAVRQSMATWNALPLFGEFELVGASSLADADIIVYDRATPLPITATNCSYDPKASAGYTYFCPTSVTPATAERLALTSGVAGRVTVVIRVDRGRVTDQAGYLALVAHEFGHALGIGGHSDEVRDLMFGLPTVTAPTSRDVQTLRYLLGRRPDITL